MQTRRDITREATLREIKDTALARMRASGSTEVRFADIARDMHMSAPGLYRYYDGRDELISALITDAFDHLAAAIGAARDEVDPSDAGGRLLAIARGYRRWARAEPQRFALLFGPPVPGYEEPRKGGTAIDAADRAMGVLVAVAATAQANGQLGPPLLPEVAPPLVECLAGQHHGDGPPAPGTGTAEPALPPATWQAMLHGFAGLHGVVSLEVFGCLVMDGDAAQEALFLGMVRLMAESMGLPAPHCGWPVAGADVDPADGEQPGERPARTAGSARGQTGRPAASGTPTAAASAAGRASVGSSRGPDR